MVYDIFAALRCKVTIFFLQFQINLKKNENSFEGFELYYKKKRIDIKFSVDKEGKFKWANNNSKLKCVSYYDGTKMSNFTRYRIINYFSSWLLENDYLSKDVTVTFEKI